MDLHSTHSSALPPFGRGSVALMSDVSSVSHRLDFDLPALQPCHAGKQFTQPLRQCLFQGGAIQFSSVHGNGRFHDAVNIAYIVNMVKRIFPMFFGLWKLKNERVHSTNFLAIAMRCRRKLRNLNDATVRRLPLVTLQRRQFHLCPASVGSMHRLAVVAERLLREPFRVAALLGALRPSVAVGMKGDALDAESRAALLEFRGAVATADGLEIGE